MVRRALLLTFCLCVISAPLYSQNQTKQVDVLPTKAAGGLVTDLPFEPSDKEFNFQIWLDSNNTTPPDKLHVRIYQNPNLTFTPQTFDLKANQPQTIKVQRRQNSAPLVEVIAKPDGNFTGIDQTINFGFKVSLKGDLPQLITPGEKRAFMLKLVDDQGKSVTLRAPAFLRLIASNAQLVTNGRAATQKLDIPLQTGANATSLIEVIPEKLKSGGTGSVQAELHASEQYILASADPFAFTIPVAGYLQFVLAILGGLLNAAYSILKRLADEQKETWTNIGVKAGVGVIGGVLAVLFMDKLTIIGIQVNQSSLAGFVAMGFILSYIGIDAFLAKTKPAAAQAQSPNPPKPDSTSKPEQPKNQTPEDGSQRPAKGRTREEERERELVTS